MGAEIHVLRSTPAARRASEAPAAPVVPSLLEQVQFPTGRSTAARRVREQIAQVARFNSTVLLLGASGTGKEMAARQIHVLSTRAGGPFVPVNCGAIPSELLESELFGHEKGAFTGAISTRQGRFELAQGGTLFLDEIGEMSPHMQVKLLRVLQQRSYERVGSSDTRDADVRIIAATNRDLEVEVHAGRFREDLFFRLNVFPIAMPALRERPQDIAPLIELFHAELELRGHQPVTFSRRAQAALERCEWPGNIRELENLLERLSVTHPGGALDFEDLPDRYRMLIPQDVEAGIELAEIAVDVVPQPSEDVNGVDAGLSIALPAEGLCLKTVLSGIERELVEQALKRADGIVSRAARLLGLGRTTLLEKMRKLHLIPQH